MKIVESAKRRIAKFLGKMTKRGAKAWSYDDAPDPRQEAKVKHSMNSILYAIELGLTSNQATLRDVEKMTESLGSLTKRLVPETISDTTLDTEVQRLDSEYLQKKLIGRVRGFHRSKMLEPFGLPCGVATVDGKNLATLQHDANGSGHKRSRKNDKWHLSKAEEQRKGKSYYLMPALRVALTSSEAKPCIYQLPLPAGTGETSMFSRLLSEIHREYGRSKMFKIIDGDAGLTSLRNANLVVETGYEYVFGLKGNQGELFTEAAALLLPLAEKEKPEVETPWEVRSGTKIRRRLWRTEEMASMENSVGKWTHLNQTWLVRQETKDSSGNIEIEDRYFVTSLQWKFLTPAQILFLVRNHWGIEIAFNALDLQWKEDAGRWCTRGDSVWALGILRLLAYNTAQMLRCRRLRKKKPDGTRAPLISWRQLFKEIERSFELDLECSYTG